MTDNVIRDTKGRFPKGVSGNPHGGNRRQNAIRKLLLKGEEARIAVQATMQAMAVPATELHELLLKEALQGKRDISVKEMIALIEMTYKFGIGSPSKAEQPKPEAHEEIEEWSDEDLDNIEAIIKRTKERATKSK